MSKLAVGEPQTSIAEQVGVDQSATQGLLVKMRIEPLLKNKRGN